MENRMRIVLRDPIDKELRVYSPDGEDITGKLEIMKIEIVAESGKTLQAKLTLCAEVDFYGACAVDRQEGGA